MSSFFTERSVCCRLVENMLGKYRYLLFLLLLLPCAVPTVSSQPIQTMSLEGFRVYNAAGERVTLNDIVAALDSVDVLFIGEQHDDSLAHVLEAELLSRAYHHLRSPDGNRPIVVSLEMFERDVQYIVDEYLRGFITEDHFLSSSRPWANYRTDYRPLVEFARSHGLGVAAANAPRRYVNLVSREGSGALYALPEQARMYLPPLPYAGASPAYQKKWEQLVQQMMPAHAVQMDSARVHGTEVHAGPSRMLQAQSLWDAAMAHTIAGQLERNPSSLVFHVVGGFHVSEKSGIPEHLEHYRPGTRSLVVMIDPVEDFGAFNPEEAGKRGDFVILTSR